MFKLRPRLWLASDTMTNLKKASCQKCFTPPRPAPHQHHKIRLLTWRWGRRQHWSRGWKSKYSSILGTSRRTTWRLPTPWAEGDPGWLPQRSESLKLKARFVINIVWFVHLFLTCEDQHGQTMNIENSSQTFLLYQSKLWKIKFLFKLNEPGTVL